MFEGWREALRGGNGRPKPSGGVRRSCCRARPPQHSPRHFVPGRPLSAGAVRRGSGAAAGLCGLPAGCPPAPRPRPLSAFCRPCQAASLSAFTTGSGEEGALRQRPPRSGTDTPAPPPPPPRGRPLLPSLPPSLLPVSLQLVHPHTGSRPPRLPWISAKAPAAGRTGQRGAPRPRSVAPPGPRRPPCRPPALPSLPPRACPTGARRPRGREGRENEQAERESGRASPRQCPRA